MLTQIFWLISLPVLIFVSYRLILWVLKRFENNVKF